MTEAELKAWAEGGFRLTFMDRNAPALQEVGAAVLALIAERDALKRAMDDGTDAVEAVLGRALLRRRVEALEKALRALRADLRCDERREMAAPRDTCRCGACEKARAADAALAAGKEGP